MRQRDYKQSMKDVGDLAWLLNGAEYNRYEAEITEGPGTRELEQDWLKPALKIARRLMLRLERNVR